MKSIKITPIPSAFYLLSFALFLSCQQIPTTPEKLCEKICKQIVKADPGASGIFFKSTHELDEFHLLVIYDIARQDTPDDPWTNRKEIDFMFHPSNDPEAPGGWYLADIGGEYLEYMGMTEGIRYDWSYAPFQTENGPRDGIIGLDGTMRMRE
jgi:hypothetical protein